MARSGIYKSDVLRARDRLVADGRYPSIDAVRRELGDTGSKGTIHRFLKEIDEEQGGDRPGVAQAPVSEALTELVARLAERLREEADERVQVLEAGQAARLAELAAERETLQRELAVQSDARAQAEGLHAGLLRLHEALQATSSRLQLDLADRSRDLAGTQERLADLVRHTESLEEKNRHAQKSLEHFRQASREQREQEARQHEQQVQYLQGELHTLRQALAVKQHEAIAANQDNARLVQQVAALQARQREDEEALRGHAARLEEWASRQSEAAAAAAEQARELAHAQARAESLAADCEELRAARLAAAAVQRQTELDLAGARAMVQGQQQVLDQLLAPLKAAQQAARPVDDLGVPAAENGKTGES